MLNLLNLLNAECPSFKPKLQAQESEYGQIWHYANKMAEI